jgi:type I restriction enzyme R subunit
VVEGHYRGGFDFAGLVETARKLRKKHTPAELVMWELLRDRRYMNLKFRRQHQFGDYIADFYCHEQKLAIELDGPVHAGKARKKHDHRRDAYLVSMGLTVLRFENEDFLASPENVLQRIADAIKLSSPAGRGTKGEGVCKDIGRGTKGEGVCKDIGRGTKGEGVCKDIGRGSKAEGSIKT